MRISRSQLMAGVAGAVLVVGGGFRCLEEHVSNPQRLGDIYGEIGSYGGSCSDPEKGVVSVRDGVFSYLQANNHEVYGFSLWRDETGRVVGVERRDSTNGGSRVSVEIELTPSDIPKFLSRAEAATSVLCPNTPNPSPNNTSPSNGSTLLTWSLSGGQGNTIG